MNNLPSKNHKKLIKLLNEIGFMVETEVRVGRYSLDCYVEDLHVGFEADTKKTHMKGRDRKRDHWIMENYKIPILRVDVEEHKDKETLKKKILDFVFQHGDDAEERRNGFVSSSEGVE